VLSNARALTQKQNVDLINAPNLHLGGEIFPKDQKIPVARVGNFLGISQQEEEELKTRFAE
jgi:hypothetical protein